MCINGWIFVLNRAYDLQLSDAMNDLQEQVKVEHAPTDKNEHGVEVSSIINLIDWLNAFDSMSEQMMIERLHVFWLVVTTREIRIWTS